MQALKGTFYAVLLHDFANFCFTKSNSSVVVDRPSVIRNYPCNSSGGIFNAESNMWRFWIMRRTRTSWWTSLFLLHPKKIKSESPFDIFESEINVIIHTLFHRAIYGTIGDIFQHPLNKIISKGILPGLFSFKSGVGWFNRLGKIRQSQTVPVAGRQPAHGLLPKIGLYIYQILDA